MFNLFKRNKKKSLILPISKAVKHGQRQKIEQFGIVIMIKDQVLFQIMKSDIFRKKGLKSSGYDDYAIVHFFNKNKTLTIDIWDKFIADNRDREHLSYEDPKDVFFYVKNIGNKPDEIQRIAFKEIEYYQIDDISSLSLRLI